MLVTQSAKFQLNWTVSTVRKMRNVLYGQTLKSPVLLCHRTGKRFCHPIEHSSVSKTSTAEGAFSSGQRRCFREAEADRHLQKLDLNVSSDWCPEDHSTSMPKVFSQSMVAMPEAGVRSGHNSRFSNILMSVPNVKRREFQAMRKE